jgi:Cu+-exporting ATPase
MDIGGMTCAACVRRIEKALTRVDGVIDATVNLATEAATVHVRAGVPVDGLVEAVTRAGYTGRIRPVAGAESTPRAARQADEHKEHDEDADRGAEVTALKRRWQVALVTGLTLMAVMYVPIYLDTMDWLMPMIFVVATVVQFWAGASIYRAAWAAARHRSTNMNTLVALGTGIAYGYSSFVTLWPGLAERWGLPLHVYFETSLSSSPSCCWAAGLSTEPAGRRCRRSGP